MMKLHTHASVQAAAEPSDRSAVLGADKPRKDFWQELFFGLLYALWGYAANLALLPFHARPFGIALLCGSNRRVWYLYAGLCIGAWQASERWLLLTVYTVLLALRILFCLMAEPARKPTDDDAEKPMRRGDVCFPSRFPCA